MPDLCKKVALGFDVSLISLLLYLLHRLRVRDSCIECLELGFVRNFRSLSSTWSSLSVRGRDYDEDDGVDNDEAEDAGGKMDLKHGTRWRLATSS